jgi:hypothetical protein
MTVFLNFSNPTLVSSGSKYDALNMKVLNGSNFTSINGSIPMKE